MAARTCTQRAITILWGPWANGVWLFASGYFCSPSVLVETVENTGTLSPEPMTHTHVFRMWWKNEHCSKLRDHAMTRRQSVCRRAEITDRQWEIEVAERKKTQSKNKQKQRQLTDVSSFTRIFPLCLSTPHWYWPYLRLRHIFSLILSPYNLHPLLF